MSAGPGFVPQAQGGHRVPLQAGRGSGGGLPTRQRRPGLVAVAVLLIVAGALGALQLATSSNKTVSVLVLVKSVPTGHVIEVADLSSTRLSGKVAYWPASDESAVVGKTASRDLVAGQLLTKSMMATLSVPDGEHALVGLSLKAGQVPSAGLADGNTVELVEVPGSTAGSLVAAPTNPAPSVGSSSLVLATGTVYAITESSTSSSAVLVTVLVPRAGSEALSVAASNGQVALLRVGS
jgi:hypothetical protein